jgi:phosphomannomutase
VITPYQMRAHRGTTLDNATVPLADSSCGSQDRRFEPLSFRGRHPAALVFGTSGLRGLVTDITDLEAYINTRGFLDYLGEGGGAQPGDTVSLAGDLRPSTDSAERSIVRAVALAIENSGLDVEYLGPLPTPALIHYALQHRRPSIMVTGSHIPFDRNGIKFNTRNGEVLKADEPGILRAVQRVRAQEYARPASESMFADDGMLKAAAPIHAATSHRCSCLEYTRRYLDFFSAGCLDGLRIVVYQHSSVARDILVELLVGLGAQVIPKGRSESFVPIDTEDISEEKLQLLQRLVDEARRTHGPIDAIVSTDGDGDRPLVAGVDTKGTVRFWGGDLLGIVAADFLDARVAVVPISANDAVDLWAEDRGVAVVKSRIGSPYVIEAMQRAQAGGSVHVVGWEANGGFLTVTGITRNSRTRDAALPIVAALCSAKERGLSLVERFDQLPRRFGQAGLIDNFSLHTSKALLQRFAPTDPNIQCVNFAEAGIQVVYAGGVSGPAAPPLLASLDLIRLELERFFSPQEGFDGVAAINTLDGIRIFFRNGDIAHFRPSGNAPQMRIYAVANTRRRAEAIVTSALREPDGILRRLEGDAIATMDVPGSVRSRMPETEAGADAPLHYSG